MCEFIIFYTSYFDCIKLLLRFVLDKLLSFGHSFNYPKSTESFFNRSTIGTLKSIANLRSIPLLISAGMFVLQ